AGVVVVKFLVELVARELDLRRVDHDDEVTRVDVGGEARLVLAAEDARDFAREAAEGFVGRVDHEPGARFVRVGLLRGEGAGGHGGAGNYGIEGVVSRPRMGYECLMRTLSLA